MNRCEYPRCRKRPGYVLAGLHAIYGTETVKAVCGPHVDETAALMHPETIFTEELRPEPSVRRSVKRALIWLVILMAVPFIAGMIYEAILMIQQGTTEPVWPGTEQVRQ